VDGTLGKESIVIESVENQVAVIRFLRARNESPQAPANPRTATGSFQVRSKVAAELPELRQHNRRLFLNRRGPDASPPGVASLPKSNLIARR